MGSEQHYPNDYFSSELPGKVDDRSTVAKATFRCTCAVSLHYFLDISYVFMSNTDPVPCLSSFFDQQAAAARCPSSHVPIHIMGA